MFRYPVKKLLFNKHRPKYRRWLFEISSKYVDYCFGDNDFDRNTNGEFWLLSALAPHLHTVFDVGANTGDYTREVLKLSKASLHCFEPDPRAFKVLKEIPGIVANNTALGASPEIKSFNRDKRSTHNSFLEIHGDVYDSIPVKISTLDSYLKGTNINHIDFLKVDVEGWELNVLKGGCDLFEKRAVDYIQFEFSGASALARTFLKDFLDFFETYGYDVYRIKPRTIEKVRWSPAKERFTLTNFLAIRNDMLIPEHVTKGVEF